MEKFKRNGSFSIQLSSSGYKMTRSDEAQYYVIEKLLKLPGLNTLFINTNAPFAKHIGGVDSLFYTLFKPTDKLCGFMKEKFKLKERQYVSVSFRFMRLLADSNECVANSKIYTQKEQEELMKRCIEKLSDIQIQTNKDILVTSDSPKFLNVVRSLGCEKYYTIKTDDVVTSHIGFSKNVSETQILKSFTEFLAISKANHVYQVQIKPMYKSVFPEWASYVGNIPYDLIVEE